MSIPISIAVRQEEVLLRETKDFNFILLMKPTFYSPADDKTHVFRMKNLELNPISPSILTSEVICSCSYVKFLTQHQQSLGPKNANSFCNRITIKMDTGP